MKEFKYVITDPEGIHARPAGILVKTVKEFACDIKIAKGQKSNERKGDLRSNGTRRKER